MCQPKPGPRCAGHLRKEMQRNEEAKSRYAVARDFDNYVAASKHGETLQREFDGTPSGQQALERKIERESSPGRIRDGVAYKKRMKRIHDSKKEALKTARAQQAQSQTQSSPVLVGVVVPDGAHDNFSQPQSSAQQMSSLQSMPSDQLSDQIDIYSREEYRLRSEMVGKSAKIRKQLQPQQQAAKKHLDALNEEFDRRFPR